MSDNISSRVLPCRSDLINLPELFISMALNATFKHGIKYNDSDLIFIEICCYLVKDIPLNYSSWEDLYPLIIVVKTTKFGVKLSTNSS